MKVNKFLSHAGAEPTPYIFMCMLIQAPVLIKTKAAGIKGIKLFAFLLIFMAYFYAPPFIEGELNSINLR